MLAKASRSSGKGYAIALTAIIALLALGPFYLSDAWLGVLGKAYIAALFALSFNLLSGQAGMLSFGHSAYLGVGAFAAIHVMKAVQAGLFWLPTPFIPLSGALAGVLAGGIAGIFACQRSSGVYFAMVTLAISELIHTIAPNIQELFGGETGISSYRAAFLAFNFGRESHVYTLILIWTVICAIVMWLFARTLFGRLAMALRENEGRLPALGFNVYWTKVVPFAISGMFAGIAGALLSIATESANYSLFSVDASTAVVLHTFIGGSSLFLGPAIGAIIMTVFGYAASDATRSWLLYQGLIFIALMLSAPRGIALLALDTIDDIADRGARALLRALLIVVAVLLIAMGIVMAFEIVTQILTTEYQLAHTQTGRWNSISVYRVKWDPLSPFTWLVAIGSVVVGVLALRRYGQRTGPAP